MLLKKILYFEAVYMNVCVVSQTKQKKDIKKNTKMKIVRGEKYSSVPQ